MAVVMDEETIEYVGVLAQLELSAEEKTQAKKDMETILRYIEKLKELDTAGVEPMTHIFSTENVFREDMVTNHDDSAAILKNAPEEKDNMFVVPRTIE